MKLVIVRHGEAEEKKPWIPDEDRRLTEKGRKDVECIAKLIPWRIEVVYTSPLKRAVETAEIIASIHKAEVRVSDFLRPENVSIENISKLEFKEVTALVGHAPSIELLLRDLIGGGRIKLKAGAAAGIETESISKGSAVLIYILTPDICYLGK